MALPSLTPATAFAVASSYGSYVSAGDPGACMYAFRAGDGRPVSEAHRTQVLDYLATREGRSCDELWELDRLRLFIERAPLANAVRS